MPISGSEDRRLHPFSIRPPPNRTYPFPSIRLSSEPISSIYLRSLVGFPAWIALWQDSQTTKVLRFRAAILCLPRSSMMASVVSAFRISRTFPRRHQVHLSPFAMWLALPTADYYGDSVAMRLASFRRSWFSDHHTC